MAQNGRRSRTGIIHTGMPLRGPVGTATSGTGSATTTVAVAAAGWGAAAEAASVVATPRDDAGEAPADPPSPAGAEPPGRPSAARRCRERSSRYSGTSVTPRMYAPRVERSQAGRRGAPSPERP